MQTEPEVSHSITVSRPPDPSLVKPRPPLLPQSFTHPLALVWVAVVPQVVLLLLNLRDYQLVSGEMTRWQSGMAQAIGAAQVALLVMVTALAAALGLTKRKIGIIAAILLLVAPILYLFLVVYQINWVLPTSVTVWILPPEQVLYDQFAFMMPLIFYAAVRLACIDFNNVPGRREWTITLLVAIGIPLMLFGFVRLQGVWRLLAYVPAFIVITGFVLLGIVIVGAVLRILVIGYVTVRRGGPLGLTILSFLVGIAGPVAGLVLNASIPFPADFQSKSVYGLALLNGLVLLLPNFRNPFLHRLIWLGQCLLFPFTFYFFLVFLPFLPLSLIGILAVGTGFLILTPTALFLVHGQRIYDGYRNEIRDGSRLVPAILGLIALGILPAWYAIGAAMDRAVLRRALDYVYSPDYRNDTRFLGNPQFIHRSLVNLRDAKAGLDLPFLSRFYSWAVFDGLVLPDDKMNEVHRAFFGVDVPAVHQTKGFFAAPRRNTTTQPATPPPHNVVLTNTSWNVQSEGNCQRATVSLQMQNVFQTVSEFATTIDLPDGVLVSGFWLHIGKDRVPGQVFEKKTALWVYQMIRDRTRRDPGILLYTSPQTLELRVFPFSPREQREVEIEFLYPATMNPTIAIGEKKLHPSGENPPSGVVVTHTGDGTSRVWLAPDTVAGLPKVKRTPYLHFIVDRSAVSDVSPESLKRVINAARTEFPEAKECLVTCANYEITDLASELRPVAFAETIDLGSLPRRGAFMPARAIKRAFLRYHDAAGQDRHGGGWSSKFPVFVLVQGTHSREVMEPELATFAKLVPDLTTYYVTTAGGDRLEPRDFGGQTVTAPGIQPVALLKLGGAMEACPVVPDQAATVDFSTDEDSADLTTFDNATRSFVRLPVTSTVSADARYGAGTGAWQEYFASIYNPSLGKAGFSKIVKHSRELGILVGSTSYIVVENSAQWKMLERKQKQKLGNTSVLEFEATAVPEPSTWCLIITGGGLLALIALRRHRRGRV